MPADLPPPPAIVTPAGNTTSFKGEWDGGNALVFDENAQSETGAVMPGKPQKMTPAEILTATADKGVPYQPQQTSLKGPKPRQYTTGVKGVDRLIDKVGGNAQAAAASIAIGTGAILGGGAVAPRIMENNPTLANLVATGSPESPMERVARERAEQSEQQAQR